MGNWAILECPSGVISYTSMFRDAVATNAYIK